MPVHVVKDGAGPSTQVPAQPQRISIPLLCPTSDCTGKTVKGRVVHKGPLVSMGEDNYVLKTVIQEDSQQDMSPDHSSINVILFGALAKDYSESVSQGDVLLVAGFTVGKSPTAHKDKLHACNLQLAGDDAWVYVWPSTVSLRAFVPSKRTSPVSTEVTKAAKVVKYTYAPLSDLTPGVVVNVYAVVTFFKQPFRTKGTDYCSTLKITDQSNKKVGCTIFCDKLEEHPKIFKMGDIIRLHRVKTQLFNGAISLLTSHGFSVVTFDGTVGSPVVPRTSSGSFKFGEEDCQAVEALRTWAANQSLVPAVPCVPLSAVQPKTYFDLTCQLLAKAPVDSSCTLLKVWDGSKCPHPLLDVFVEPNTLEGSPTLSKDIANLTANVLVYDNHVEVSRQLKPGSYLRIYNLHAVPGASRLPSNDSGQSDQTEHLGFYLHGGSSYGKGLRVLPDDSPDILDLKRILETFSDSDINDSSLFEVWSTPPESIGMFTFFTLMLLCTISGFPVNIAYTHNGLEGRGLEETFGTTYVSAVILGASPDEIATERKCDHTVEQVSLAEVKSRGPPQVFHVQAQLKSYQPQRLYQSLKLYCHECKTIRDVPDDVTVGGVFSEAQKDVGPCNNGYWTLELNLPREPPSESPSRNLTLLISSQLMGKGKAKELIFLKGATLEETCRIASAYSNIVPVTSPQGTMTPLDLSAPFLFRGTKRYYGCKQCSQLKVGESLGEGVEVLDEKSVADALGVQLLQYGLLMKLELQDGTGSLEALLWRDAESFFHVSAEDAANDQEAQDRVQETMDRLCPPGSSMAERPWMDLCLSAYTVEENGQRLTCYQICHTDTRGTNPHTHPHTHATPSDT
ncbi:protection of telomeres protein 1 isoform X2 [Coregonus clupeaformis]|uniref:protection of telomeres protein 1 isoform X2 n=1 Tax=Coregonus clupeaformis TaxID=59861 RepID=UPI001E1C5A17|nr:protection of telomeres protein 1 isoform X2 [Coregonus clupeaformis]